MTDYKNPEYWNSKWERSHIIYRGRTMRNRSELLGIDVRNFITSNDIILSRIIKYFRLRRDSYNEPARKCHKFVANVLTFKEDDESVECPEFWQFPFETIQTGVGDCEDGAILLASLMINAGIPSWRVKVASGFALHLITKKLMGHTYVLYLADRPDSKRGLEWVILDWCYLKDTKTKIEDKPLAKDGGKVNAYKQIWLTFNDEYCWSADLLEINEARSRSGDSVLSKEEGEIKLEEAYDKLVNYPKKLKKEFFNVENLALILGDPMKLVKMVQKIIEKEGINPNDVDVE